MASLLSSSAHRDDPFDVLRLSVAAAEAREVTDWNFWRVPRANSLYQTAPQLNRHFTLGGLQNALVLFTRHEIERDRLADHCLHIGEAARYRVQR